MTSTEKKPVTKDPSYTSLGGHWCTIESTPTVFNALFTKNGIRDTYVKEVWSLEPELFNMLKDDHVYGFIFLLRPQDGRMSKYEELLEPVDTSHIYFANQVIPDACGTQALLSIAMNSPDMEIGPVLNEFKEFTAKFEPKASVEDDSDKEGEDQFHYVAYVYIDGYIWELDGLQTGPLRRAACTKETWLDAARVELKARMMSYDEGEEHFVLMAVVKDPLTVLRERLDKLRKQEGSNNKSKSKNKNEGSKLIKEVEQEIKSMAQEREAEKREIRELEADFRESIDIFMRAYVKLQEEDEGKKKAKGGKKRKRR
ncbi:ubiquitin carboxyl-terminal hydrolase [Mortierella sp. AM989]|nr:ubiquitin carboxyl-terminal hydrolase [Mortierella sp. AM989]